MTEDKNNSNAVNKHKKQRTYPPKGVIPPQVKPFKSRAENNGQIDPRINVKGRPKSFDELRSLFQEIAHENIEMSDGKKVTRARAIGLMMSMDKKLMREFLEYAFGKVPQAVDVKGKLDSEIVLRVVREDTKKIDAP